MSFVAVNQDNKKILEVGVSHEVEFLLQAELYDMR